ncbi:MAG: cytochrome P450 [Planctomycetales bacterium]
MAVNLFRTLYRRRAKPFDGIPGPEPIFPVGNGADFLRGWPWERCADYASRYGGLTLVWLGGSPALVLNDPVLIGEVLVDRWQDFYKDIPVKALQPVITPGSLFISNPPNWTSEREQNPLARIDQEAWLDGLIQPVSRLLRERLQGLVASSASRPLSLHWEMQRLTFDVFSLAFWGQVLPPDRFEWFLTLARTGSRRMSSPLPLFPPINPKLLVRRQQWYQSFEQLVAQARSTPPSMGCGLLQGTLALGTSLSDAALAEALATNFFGGVFSCSSTINTALYLLATHPAEKNRLLEGLRETLGMEPPWDLRVLRGCQPLEQVLLESMRYYPAVPLYFRNSAADRIVKLGDYELPPKTRLFISNWGLHRQSGHWNEPQVFDPGRWNEQLTAANPLGSGYFFPFGRGPRMCIGLPFAMFYVQLALATIYSQTEVELDPQQPYQPSFFFGVMMPRGLRVRFR